MAVKYYDLNFDSRRTYLGNVGYFDENEYRALRINVASVLEDYPNASFKVILQRANDTHPYEKATSDVTLLDDKLVASLNETDYNKPGRLLVQVTFTSGEVTGKSGIFIADVGKSLSSDTTDPQSPYADALKEIDDALEKIDDFLATGGGAISSEIIEEAVSNYLEENPISETDPTVPAWAKAAEKPSYSYNELTDKPTIPDAYNLPVASESTLGGVKPISKTDDMTQGVGVDSEGKLWALPGGGSESTGGSTGGIPAVTTEGTGAAYTATIPEITELYAGLLIAVKFHTSNKASATLNVNGLGAYSIYTQVANRSNTTNEAIPLNYVGTSGIHLMMFNGSSWKLFYTTKVNVNAGGTGLTSLTSGSYLVGNSTSAVTLKTPAQVLADILPSTTDDVGKVPTVQEDGTIALAAVSSGGGSSGGGETAWNTICEGLIPEAVESIVIDSAADGTPLADLDVNELLIVGNIKLSADSKLRFEHNGLWTSGNYIETDNKLGAWNAALCIHQRKFPSGISTEIAIHNESFALFTNNSTVGAFPIKSFEIHTSPGGVTFATDKTEICAYYR